jgi:hypothetical protein
MVDTSDIIQQQYVNAADTTDELTHDESTTAGDTTAGDTTAEDTHESVTNNHKEITIDNTLMRKYAGVSTLDNFVIKQPNETKETRIIPLIIDVDLKEPSLKKKGVKEKVKKSTKGAKGAELSEKLVIKSETTLNENNI